MSMFKHRLIPINQKLNKKGKDKMKKDLILGCIFATAFWAWFAICLYVLTPMVFEWLGK